MIGGMARLGKWFIDSGMRRGTPPADYEHVITVYRGTDAWKQRVGVDERDTAYLILLDRTGKVAWRHAGGLDGRRTRRWLPKFRSFLDQGSGKNNLSA